MYIPTFTMMVGLPGSGKSTYAKKLTSQTDALYINPDSMRKEMTGLEDCFNKDKEIFGKIPGTIKKALLSGKNVVYDATNLSAKRRKGLLNEIGKIPCMKECVIMATPLAVCLNQNNMRDRHVPDSVIEEMYKSFTVPYLFEGWDEIYIQYNDPEYRTLHGKPENFYKDYMRFTQDNPHHKETLGAHVLETYNYVLESGYEPNSTICLAALLHDCGKPITKTFINAKGEKSDHAHYYGHEHVGSYETLFYDIPEAKKLRVSALVCYHMDPYSWEKDSTAIKKKRQWGPGPIFFDNIILLHEADRHASIPDKSYEEKNYEYDRD